MKKLSHYRIEEDGPFLPKEIFSQDLCCSGLTPVTAEETCSVKSTPGAGDAFVLQGEYGKCYEVKFTPASGVIAAMNVPTDPRCLAEGESVEGTKMDRDYATQNCFMYVCRSQQDYLVICVSDKTAPISIGERTILQGSDTVGDWFIPTPATGL